VKNAHPHNAALQLLSEYGLLAGTAGVALVILLLLFAVKTLREQTREIPDPATSRLCAALFMGLTDSMFSGNLIMSHSQILLFVIAGWLVGQSQKKPEVMNERNSGWRLAGLTLGGVAMLAMCTTAILAFEYVDVVNTMPGNLQPRYPHFWQYGRFAGW